MLSDFVDQSSTGRDGVAGLAVDGINETDIHSPDFGGYACTHSTYQLCGHRLWWRAMLHKPAIVTSISLLNRGGGCSCMDILLLTNESSLLYIIT